MVVVVVVVNAGLVGKGGNSKHKWLVDITANVNGKTVSMPDKKVSPNGWGSEPDIENCLGYLKSTAKLVKTITDELGITREDFNKSFSTNTKGQCSLAAIRDRAEENGLTITFTPSNMRPAP
jgi:hypothetical protein